MKFVPFTVHFRVTPDRPGKRFETIRSMQKISEGIYDAILDLSDIDVAEPGGGQQRSYSGTDLGGLSGFVNACAIKPQFGNFPAQLMLEGFYNTDNINAYTYSETQLIHAGESVSGPRSHRNDAVPTTTINDEVKALKTALDSAIAAAVGIPTDADVAVFRINYSGVIYGDRGFHFPR